MSFNKQETIDDFIACRVMKQKYIYDGNDTETRALTQMAKHSFFEDVAKEIEKTYSCEMTGNLLDKVNIFA